MKFKLCTVALVAALSCQSAIAAEANVVEMGDLPDDLGVPATGPATQFMPGVNRLTGTATFDRSPGVFDLDNDELLFEILPGQKLEQVTVVSRGFSSSGSIADVELQASIRESDSQFASDTFILEETQGTMASFATDFGPGLYVAAVDLGFLSFGPTGSAQGDYLIEYTVSAVPEPVGLGLIGPAMAVFGLVRRTRRRAA